MPPPATALSPQPLSLRISLLNLRLFSIQDKYKSSAEDILNYYHVGSARIETERYQALQTAFTRPWQLTGVIQIYDKQHSDLIKRVQEMCDALDSCSPPSSIYTTPPQPAPLPPCTNTTLFSPPTSTVTAPTRPSKRRRLTNTAISIMEKWYSQNQEHPYPNQEATQLLATAGNVSPEQVKKWFANRRLRMGNTKQLSEIARRRKRPLDSQETYTKRMRQL
jgi:hypothetical protein